ncbi:hypothetical protein MWN33_16470 [Starkeya koreensis]|uniref:Uncharacterized protein n=1 Tax=Ancylobacter koreensis TaxID=266121 RepID=A0ABT0DQS2_9HYPH|nr:hypothetical protein [Ancylobacter koreensis]MCK0209628.1 hypothetical protein [Ancylobacter koreensis]
MIERRLFLKLAASSLGTLAVGAPASARSWEAHFASASWARLGARVRLELPSAELAVLDEEGNLLLRRFGSVRAGLAGVVGEELELRLADDFRSGRVTRVGGVSFARTEVVLFLLAARPGQA